MKFLKTIKAVIARAVIVEKIGIIVKTVKNKQFMQPQELDNLINKIEPEYKKALENTKNKENLKLNGALFNIYTCLLSMIESQKGEFTKSNKLIELLVEVNTKSNIKPTLDSPDNNSFYKSIPATNSVRLLLLEKEKGINTPQEEVEFLIQSQNVKVSLFSLKQKPNILGEIALYHFIIEDKESATSYLKARVEKESNIESLYEEIYENVAIKNTKIGQDYFNFVEDFINKQKSNNDLKQTNKIAKPGSH